MRKIGTSILILAMLIGIISSVTLASESTGAVQNGTTTISTGTTEDKAGLGFDLNGADVLSHHGGGGPGGPGGHEGHRRHGGPGGPGRFGDNFVLLFAALAVIVLLGCSEHSDY